MLLRAALCGFAFWFIVSEPNARAQSTPTGVIEGLVINPDSGRRIERARIRIEETGHETFSDASGHYRLANVPAGSVTLQAFFTGLAPKTETFTVTAGGVVQRNIELTPSRGKAVAGDETIRLSQMVITESREMDGAAIAINEQRFAPNLRNVVAADEFGPVVDDNVGEILKFLPGIEPVLGEGAVRGISINGVPQGYVPVTLDGFDVSSAQGTSRNVDLIFASTNNLSRIEVVYSPTPESPGAALAGSVNMVQRSAFERVKPVFNASVYLLMRDRAVEFDKTPGPGVEPTRKVNLGVDFSYIAPVNKRFGFSLSGGSATQYLPSLTTTATWRGASGATNGGTLPDTTADAPYLTDYVLRDFQAETTRSAIGATTDFKIGDNSRLTFSFQHVIYNADSRARQLSFNVNRVLPGNFSPTFTRGFVGAGDIEQLGSGFTRKSRSYMPTLTYRHNGPVWNLEAGLGYSLSNSKISEVSRGYVTTAVSRRSGVTINFDDIVYGGPNRITVTDGATGAPVDPYAISSYALVSGTLRMHHDATGNWGDKVLDAKRSAYANVRRDFSWRVPISLKAGLDVRHAMRDLRAGTESFSFVGADGRASTTPAAAGSDDHAVMVADPRASDRLSPYGYPKIQYISIERLLDLYRSRPAYLTLNQDAAYRSEVNNSKHAEEAVSSAYFRADAHLLEGRVKLVGGLRAEQTNVKAEGPRNDPTRNFQRDANGRVILGANGRPLPIATVPLEISRRTLIERGTRTKKEYLRFFPSLNASFNLRPDLIARGAYYHSVGRPDFNQYAGGVTLPDTESVPGPGNRITVNNAGIKAWSARTVKLSLEYYFKGVGQFSVGAFRREFENFFGATTLNATPEFLALYSLDPDVYSRYDVATQFNLDSTVRMQGFDFNYKQALTFLPRWARGVQVFANASVQRAMGEETANFEGFIPRTANWGASLTRERYNLKLNWNYRSRARAADVNGRGIAPGTFNWRSPQLKMDVTAEYLFSKRFSAFVNVRDLTNEDEDIEIHNPATPAYARLRSHKTYMALWTIGIKGTF